MNLPTSSEKFHFIGVCGTAMGSVAAAMKAKGYQVTGSDQAVYPPMSDFLREQGVKILEGYHENHLGDATVVVVGNAISRGNPEAEAVLNQRLRYLSLPEVLREYFLRGKQNLVVTGTHGKTTTSALLAWILESSGANPSFMIGGIPKNLRQGARFLDSAHTVLEGDEYDTAFFDKRSKFLHYLPEVVIINNIEFDHADIYQNIEEIRLTFRRLLNIIPTNGIAFINGDDPNCLQISQNAPSPVSTVGLGSENNLPISNIRYEETRTLFDFDTQTWEIPMVGEFNVRNAAMAIAAARFAKIPTEKIKSALLSFSGIARRQEEKGTVRGVTVVDDFAHHPTAIRLAIAALRQKYPNRPLWVLFEPRSNTTRRNIFQKELAEALALADRVSLPTIEDSSKVPPAERLDPALLLADIQATGTPAAYHAEIENIVHEVATEAQKGHVIAVLSNGGFGGIHQKILTALATAP